MNTFRYSLLSLLLTITSVLGASAAVQTIPAADSAYHARNYVLAAELYEQMLAARPAADVYYNLGNARWRMQDTARAICAYHRALALSPSHSDARYNLEYCQAQLQDRFATPSAMFFTVLLRRMVEGHSVSFWLTMGCLSFVVLLFGWALWRNAVRTLWMRVGLSVFLLGVLLTLAANALAFWRNVIDRADDRAVVTQTITLCREPSTASASVCSLHAGTTVQTLHRGRNGWVQVSLPDGRNGWVTESGLLFVRISPLATE